MTKQKFDWNQFKPIPGFDGLKWKAERHAQMNEETKNMTPEEVREYFRKASERMWKAREEYQRRIAEEKNEN